MTGFMKNIFTSGDKPLSVTEFYLGKSILVTGFTGLLGKLIVEKLLWSCPDIKNIFILLRPKKGSTPQQRLEKAVNLLAFDRVRCKYPEALRTKLIGISGDLSLTDLGLSEEDRSLICKSVQLVIHSAASVRFDDTLKDAVQMNMIGTKMLLDLATNMEKIECFLHVSTAYSNCDNLHIDERMYPPKDNWKGLIDVAREIDPYSLQVLSAKYMDEIPNTYIFTKGLTEHIVNDYRKVLPVAIVRPSVVVPAYKEPVPGWIDNPFGPLGINLGFITGLARCGWGDENNYANYIHTDFVVNSILLATYKRVISSETTDETQIYNACSPPSYKCTHKDYSLLHKYGPTEKYLNGEGINYSKFMYIKPYNCFRVNFIFRHMISALLIDLLLMISGKSQILTKARRGIFIANKRLRYFVDNSITFNVTNFLELPDSLSNSDKEHFDYSFSQCRMNEVYYNAIVLSKKVLLKPLYRNIEMTRKVLKWLYILDTGAVFFTYLLVILFLYKINILSLTSNAIINFCSLT